MVKITNEELIDVTLAIGGQFFLHGYIRHIRDISQLCKDVEDAVWWGAVAHQDDESSHWADFLANSIKTS